METPVLTPTNVFERFSLWLQESIMIKLFSIGFLILILLIPSSWIQDLILERQSRADEVIREVSDKWSDSQTVSGPVLIIPFLRKEKIDHGKGNIEIIEHTERAYFLPEKLQIDGTVKPEILHRGIFDAVVYESSLQIQSAFIKPDFKGLSIPEENVLWKDAQIVFGITDLRGISDNPEFNIGDNSYVPEPSNNIGILFKEGLDQNYHAESERPNFVTNGIMVKPNWSSAENFEGHVNVNLNLKGSVRLDFTPVGKTTQVNLKGSWASPSFDGVFLPASREVSDDGFSATWKVLHFNRPFSQQWIGQEQALSGGNFGLKLLVPVDQYQKSIRTSKYGVLIILLTFIALFMVEIIRKIRIHPFQYILIGAALILYYTLLLSFSEHVGYNIAYTIASVATVGLVTLYARTFLSQTSLVVLFSLLLSVFYSFIFVIILQQDFSLLLGSVGLFIILGLLMYFSRKVRWYKEPVVQP